MEGYVFVNKKNKIITKYNIVDWNVDLVATCLLEDN